LKKQSYFFKYFLKDLRVEENEKLLNIDPEWRSEIIEFLKKQHENIPDERNEDEEKIKKFIYKIEEFKTIIATNKDLKFFEDDVFFHQDQSQNHLLHLFNSYWQKNLKSIII
jgi:hypothetical protein